MTYENAIEYAIENVDIADYNSYPEWQKAIEDKLQTPELFEEKFVTDELREYWIQEVGSLEREIPEHPLGETREQRRLTILSRLRRFFFG